MQDDCIAVALGLLQLRILKQKELEGHFEVTVIYRRKGLVCPRCSKVTTKELWQETAAQTGQKIKGSYFYDVNHSKKDALHLLYY